MPFKSLGLSEPLLKTIAEQNYTQPYPIQQEAIPSILKVMIFWELPKRVQEKQPVLYCRF